jgi:hypothetical protein
MVTKFSSKKEIGKKERYLLHIELLVHSRSFRKHISTIKSSNRVIALGKILFRLTQNITVFNIKKE